jgi:glucokinase
MTRMRVVIGVDVGGTTTAAGLVGDDGEVLASISQPTHAGGPGTALASLEGVLDRIIPEAHGRGLEAVAAGIGVPGTVDAETGTVGAEAHYVPDLVRLPLGSRLAGRIGLPVFVDNDVNALALGEWMFGAGRGAGSMVLLALGTGVGGGIILDGRLVRGHGGYGGELGHVPINFDGRPCICGGRGCLKAYVSGTDIALEGSRRLGRDLTAPEVFRLAASGEASAAKLVGEVSEALGAGLAVIVNGLNPERLLLAGGVAESLRPLEGEIRAACARYAFPGACATTRFEIIALDKGSAVRGGAALARYETRRRERAMG